MAALHADHRQLSPVRSPDHRAQRVELVDDPADRAAALGRSRLRDCSRAKSTWAESARRPKLSATSMSRCRSFVITTTRSPPTGRQSFVCMDWSTPTLGAARCRQFWSSPVKTAPSNSPTSRCARRPETNWSTRWTCSWKPVTRWWLPADPGPARPRCCAAWPNCGPTPREFSAARPAITRRCSCRSCRMCRWELCVAWCAIRSRRTTSRRTRLRDTLTKVALAPLR